MNPVKADYLKRKEMHRTFEDAAENADYDLNRR